MSLSAPAQAATIDLGARLQERQLPVSVAIFNATLATGGELHQQGHRWIHRIGVTGGRTNDEIDDNGEAITGDVRFPGAAAAFRILFIYNGPEFGDPQEIAKVTFTTPGGPLVGTFDKSAASTILALGTSEAVPRSQ